MPDAATPVVLKSAMAGHHNRYQRARRRAAMRAAAVAVVLGLAMAGCLGAGDGAPDCPDCPPTGPGPSTGPSNGPGPTSGTAAPPSPNGTRPDVPPSRWNWTSPDEATIRPGSQTIASGSQCTTNFVFSNATDLFIGQAAHCTGEGAPNETDGCAAPPGRLNGTVSIEGAQQRGILVYSSWITMQKLGENQADVCRYNDFALVRIDPADHARAHPAMRFYGGPDGIEDPEDVRAGQRVLTYGNSGFRMGVAGLMPREGWVVGSGGNGWTTQVLTLTPGVPGDSGSAVIMDGGAGLGILVTVGATGTNGVTSLKHALHYAQQHSGIEGLQLEGWEQLRRGNLPG